MANKKLFLKLVNISKHYPSPDPAAEPSEILKNLDLEIYEGQSIAILGPSGVGKSTLLNIIGAIDQPTSGQIFFDGKNLDQFSEKELSIYRNREIGLIFQDHHLLPQCTTVENVLLPTLVPGNGISPKSVENTAIRLLNRVGLTHRLNHRPAQLSGGERQRVAVARSLINSPRLVLADEPTGALDHTTATLLSSLLVDLNREEGVSLITVTHSMELARRMQIVFQLKDASLILVC